MDARHLSPGGESRRTNGPGVGDGQEMPTEAKQSVDGRMGREELLSMTRGFKSAHLPFLLPGRLMGEFGPVI